LITATAIFVNAGARELLWPVVGAAAGVYWFYKGFRMLQRKRLIQNTPASKIRSASMGLVEISGLATGPYVLTSPFKGVECYFYRSIAWEMEQQGKSSKWVKAAEETLHVPFYVDDSTDKVLVDPRGAEMDLHCDFHEQYHRSVLFSGPEMPGAVSQFLLRHSANPNKRIKVEEYCIKPKNFLFVLGTMSQNPGLDASIMPSWAEHAGEQQEKVTGNRAYHSNGSDNPLHIIKLTGHPSAMPVTAMTQQQKIAAALTKAGISNPAAWNAAGINTDLLGSAKTQTAAAVQSAPELPKRQPNFEGFDLHPPVVLMQGSHDPAFFISWRSPRDIVNSLSWKSSLMIWGGPALTLACVYFLLARFGWL